MADDPSIEEELERILEQVQGFDRRLIQGLEGAWTDLESILRNQGVLLESTVVPPSDHWELEHFHSVRQQLSDRLFSEPAMQWDRRRPYKRALSAVEAYEVGLADLVRSVPETVVVQGRSRDLLRKYQLKGWRSVLVRLRRVRRIPMRALLAQTFERRLADWLEIEGAFFLGLARALRMLRISWEIRRSELDAQVLGEHERLPEIEILRQELGTEEELRKKVQGELDRIRAWSSETPLALAAGILTSVRKPKPGGLSKERESRNKQRNHMIQQLRSVETEVRLEQGLLRTEQRTFELATETLENLRDERRALLQELDEMIAWCRSENSVTLPIPAPKAGFVPVSSRLRDFEQSFRAELEKLPATAEVLTKLTALPLRRLRWQNLAPRTIFGDAYRRSAQAGLLSGLEEIDGEHRRIVREIERAREVVAFGQETATGEHDSNIADEAIRNTLSLLEYTLEQSRDWGPSVSEKIARSLAAVFSENRVLLRQRRLGALLYLWRQGFRRGLPIVLQGTIRGAIRGARYLYKGAASAADRLLISIGWKATFESGGPEVTTRTFLPAEFTVDLTTKELPAIYRRLFRFAPVEDPRFLIGREDELRGLSEARDFWEQGRPVSVIIVGRRGSGKTSLINCALKRSLEGLEIIRGEISTRVTSDEDFRAAIARIAGLSDPSQLEEFLATKRRAFVLEELERTFLRQVGHYGAIRGLQRLIASTSSSTLWVVAINQVAFRFLDASIALGQSFSHRINAGTVGREDLKQAILLRHNLSGLRLEFAPPPPPTRLAQRVRQRLQGKEDPETIFFGLLAKESAGVFRSAFEIWLGQIDRAAAGTLYLKPLLDADLSAIVGELDLRDLFTLVGILQHGSLTPDEHAKIFQVSLATSRAQIDELAAREIIEPDPGRTGFRVRPEAMRVVHEALYRRNLL